MAKTRASTKDARAKWVQRIVDEMKAHRDWRDYAESAEKAYFADKSSSATGRVDPFTTYPLFASTIKVIHGRVFSQPPKPDVRKRYADDQPIGQQPDAAQPPAQPGGAPNSGGPAPPVGGGAPSGMGAPVPGGAGVPQPPGGAPAGGPQGPVPPQPAGAMPQPAPVMPGSGQPPAQPVPPPVDDNKLAQLIERALGYTIDTTGFDADGHACVNDFLVAALGTGKVEMDTDTESQPVLNPLTQQPILLDKKTQQPLPLDPMTGQYIQSEDIEVEPAMQDVIVDQTVRLRHFSWSQFHWEPQQNWSQVGWVAFDHWMTKAAIEAKFDIELDTVGGTNDTGGVTDTGTGAQQKPDAAKYKDLFCVHEIWDKKNKERLFVMQEHPNVLDEEDDPLGLADFFPCPRPMFMNLRGDDLLPMPDYTYCEYQFRQCNQLTNRIGAIIKQVKDVGFYDASFPELAQMQGNPPDGTRIPIAGMMKRFTDAGSQSGLDGMLSFKNNGPAVETLQQLLQMREAFKSDIYEIYGVPDIIRGSSDPNETATAQGIKAQWADVRIGEKVRTVALFFRDVFRIMAEIMAERFQPDILEKMTGIRLSEPELDVLRSDYGRSYAIDVESDSTASQDEYAARQETMDMVNTVGNLAKELIPAIQQGAIPADFGKELLLAAAGAFKSGRQLEQAINSLPNTTAQLAQLTQKATQAQQQADSLQKTNAAMQKQIQASDQQEQQRKNVETQLKGVATQADNQQKAAETTRTEAETANLVQDISHKAAQPVVVPFQQPKGTA